MSTVGGYLEYSWGVFSTGGRYHELRGGYLKYRGGCSIPWGISLAPWGGGCSVLLFEYCGGIS